MIYVTPDIDFRFHSTFEIFFQIDGNFQELLWGAKI